MMQLVGTKTSLFSRIHVSPQRSFCLDNITAMLDNLTKTSGGHLGIAQHWFWSDCATTQCGTTSFCPIDPIPPLSSLYLCQIFLVFLSLEYPYIRLICIFVKYFLVFCLSVSRFLSLCFSLTLIIDHTMAGL